MGGVKEHICDERLKPTKRMCLVISSACNKRNRLHTQHTTRTTPQTNNHTNIRTHNDQRRRRNDRLIVEVVVVALRMGGMQKEV